MNIEEIYHEKRKLIEGIISEGYSAFEAEINHDPRFSLSDDEMAEMFYELLQMEINNTIN